MGMWFQDDFLGLIPLFSSTQALKNHTHVETNDIKWVNSRPQEKTFICAKAQGRVKVGMFLKVLWIFY